MKELIGLALALFAASWVIYNAIKFINLRNKKQEVKDMVKSKKGKKKTKKVTKKFKSVKAKMAYVRSCKKGVSRTRKAGRKKK